MKPKAEILKMIAVCDRTQNELPCYDQTDRCRSALLSGVYRALLWVSGQKDCINLWDEQKMAVKKTVPRNKKKRESMDDEYLKERRAGEPE